MAVNHISFDFKMLSHQAMSALGLCRGFFASEGGGVEPRATYRIIICVCHCAMGVDLSPHPLH